MLHRRRGKAYCAKPHEGVWVWDSQHLQKLIVHQILCGFPSKHFKASASQQKQLCSFATYPHFLPIVNLSSLLWLQLSIKSQLLALHIPPSRGHKPQFLSPTLFSSLENGDTGWQSHCIKSICRLNLQLDQARFQPLLLFSKRFVCVSSRCCPVRF